MLPPRCEARALVPDARTCHRSGVRAPRPRWGWPACAPQFRLSRATGPEVRRGAVLEESRRQPPYVSPCKRARGSALLRRTPGRGRIGASGAGLPPLPILPPRGRSPCPRHTKPPPWSPRGCPLRARWWVASLRCVLSSQLACPPVWQVKNSRTCNRFACRKTRRFYGCETALSPEGVKARRNCRVPKCEELEHSHLSLRVARF